MFKSPVLKSGGPPMEYPKTVWTPTGGWYCDNPMWKRNTALVGAGLAVCAVFLFKYSASLERRYRAGPIPVPSQSWSSHTLEDDPLYLQKVADRKKNGKSLWSRIFQNEEDFMEE